MEPEAPKHWPQEIQEMITLYNVSGQRCRAVNKEIIVPQDNRYQMACMLAGFKDILFTENFEALDDLPLNLLKLYNKSNIHDVGFAYPSYLGGVSRERIFYTPHGFRNALLLAKNILEKNLESFESNRPQENSYLTGTLLNYRNEDKDFFEIYPVFIQWYMGQTSKSRAQLEAQFKLIEFPGWDQQTKDAFLLFEREIFPQTSAFDKLQQTKKDAHNWINAQSSFSVQNLHQQIQALMNQSFAQHPAEEESEESSQEESD